MYKQKIVLSQVFWVEIRNLAWARHLLMVFLAFALASFALSATAQGQLPFKPAPQGMYISSRGYLSSSNQAASAAGPSINNANCDGVRWHVKWSDIEVTPNNYNWQYLDDAVAFAATNNKTCGISINAGTCCPEWLYAPPYNVQSYTLVDTVVVDHIPVGAKIPVPGDSMFMTRWQQFITDFGARYDNNPAVSYVIICGIGNHAEWDVANGLQDTAALGNTIEKVNAWKSSSKQIIDFYMSAFPSTTVMGLPVPPFNPLNAAEDPAISMREVSDYAANTYNCHFAYSVAPLQSCTSRWNYLPANELFLHWMTNPTYGETLNPASSPDDFDATLHVALDLNIRGMEIYKVDFENADLQNFIVGSGTYAGQAGGITLRRTDMLAIPVPTPCPATATPTVTPTGTPAGPYPRSSYIRGVTFDQSTLYQAAPGSDLWGTTQAQDGNLYSVWGDGGGFGGSNTIGFSYLGIAKISGDAPSQTGVNVWGGNSPLSSQTPIPGKANASIISVDNKLYIWVGQQDVWTSNHLWQSADLGMTWTDLGLFFTTSDVLFSVVSSLQFGANYAGARDGYVYGYYARWSTYGNVYLCRVAKANIENRASYEFFSGTSSSPAWSSNIADSAPIFYEPSGTTKFGVTCVYHPGYHRYIMRVRPDGETGIFGLYDAPEPWGPWTTIAYGTDFPSWIYTPEATSLGMRETNQVEFPQKWMSGADAWMIYDRGDKFNLVKATFSPAPASPTPTPTGTPTPTVQVTVQTTPVGLVFMVDGVAYTSTQTFSWSSDSSHTIATTSPQNGGAGVQYVWANWSDCQYMSHAITPLTDMNYIATFTTQYYLTMGRTTGGTVSLSSGWRDSGATVSITETPTNNNQVSYSFSGWTGSGSDSYSGTNNPASITMNGPITETASFTQNPVQVTVQTSPANLSFAVDGTSYTAAQTFSWQPGSSHTIETISPQNGATGVRYAWTSWTGGGAISHTVAPTTNQTYTAIFRTQYYLTMTHGTGGTAIPASGWKNSDAAVSITATPATGYSFSNWTGSGTGSFSDTTNPASITMGGPITETATFTHN